MESQALAHGIGDQVGVGGEAGVVRHLAGDGVGDDLTNVYTLLVVHLIKGNIVLVVDGDSGIGGGQVTQSTVGTGDEVVAQIQIGGLDGSAVSSQGSPSLAGHSRFQSIGKSRCAESVGRGHNEGSLVTRNTGQSQTVTLGSSIGLDRAVPLAGSLDCIGIVAAAVGHIKNLVRRIGLIGYRIVNNDGAFVFRRKSGGCHGKYHDHHQQEAGKFFRSFHCFVSFHFVC